MAPFFHCGDIESPEGAHLSGTRISGICGLCLHHRKLHDSHLVPAAAYKPLRSAKSTNPHPLVVTDTSAYQTSRQAKDYLLCFDCEQRFHARGENWVLSHSYRAPGKFKFKKILRSNDPMFSGPDGAIYAAGAIPELDMNQVIYFGASVFWRAAVHSWRRDNRIIALELGPYREPLRKFLYEDDPFPEHMVLHVWISSLDDHLCAVLNLPESGTKHGIHTHQFGIPGMTFELMVGSNIPRQQFLYSTAPAPERFMAVIRSVDLNDTRDMLTRLANARARIKK
jgi:hypothetical protein